MRSISVNEKTAIRHVDEHARESSFRLLSRNRTDVRFYAIMFTNGRGVFRSRAHCYTGLTMAS